MAKSLVMWWEKTNCRENTFMKPHSCKLSWAKLFFVSCMKQHSSSSSSNSCAQVFACITLKPKRFKWTWDRVQDEHLSPNLSKNLITALKYARNRSQKSEFVRPALHHRRWTAFVWMFLHCAQAPGSIGFQSFFQEPKKKRTVDTKTLLNINGYFLRFYVAKTSWDWSWVGMGVDSEWSCPRVGQLLWWQPGKSLNPRQRTNWLTGSRHSLRLGGEPLWNTSITTPRHLTHTHPHMHCSQNYTNTPASEEDEPKNLTGVVGELHRVDGVHLKAQNLAGEDC